MGHISHVSHQLGTHKPFTVFQFLTLVENLWFLSLGTPTNRILINDKQDLSQVDGLII
jgi:hypothetical protein